MPGAVLSVATALSSSATCLTCAVADILKPIILPVDIVINVYSIKRIWLIDRPTFAFTHASISLNVTVPALRALGACGH
ncbi:hypothetical protein ACQKWADRAFT_302412 [Trichoderma austrokoningii]